MRALEIVEGDPRRDPGGPVDFNASYILAIDLAPVSERQNILSDLANLMPWSTFAIMEDRPDPAGADEPAPELDALRSHLWPQAEVYLAAASSSYARTAVVALRKGGYVLVRALQPPQPGTRLMPPSPNGNSHGVHPFGQPSKEKPDGPAASPSAPSLRPQPPGPPPFHGPPSVFILSGSALFFFLCAAILTIWMSNTIVSPLVKLAQQAERFPNESYEGELIAGKGPQEVRNLTRALNRMQIRISSMIAARAQVLAAVSHDLRTIITRMRLRAEFIEDEMLRNKMLQDAELMDSMLYKNLLHLRQARPMPEQSLVDLDSVLQTVSDQFADLGHDVTYRGGGHQMIRGSLTDMQRVFNNLIENAVTYSGKAVVVIEEPSADVIQIDIMDEGPGIPAQDKARLIEPFVRGQPGRNMNEHGGFGLGLSIVKVLVEEASGTLQLLDREPQGLIARVTLPRAFVADPGLGSVNMPEVRTSGLQPLPQ